MDQFVSRKRRALEHSNSSEPCRTEIVANNGEEEEDSTEVKLAILASLCPVEDIQKLMEALLAAEGSVEAAASALGPKTIDYITPPRKRSVLSAATGYQSSLRSFHDGAKSHDILLGCEARKLMTQKGKTLHLYSPEDIARHTPCSIIHNFLPPDLSRDLLEELLVESPSFGKDTFTLFDRIVTSPHTMAFYVDEWSDAERQRTEYVYNGSHIEDVRRTTPVMRKVSGTVATAVNDEIQKRIRTHYPGQTKLKYQSPKSWEPNTAFVNCYDGGSESVGYHSDQLTYLGPRAVIGSLSLGVAREFRVRRIVPREKNASKTSDALTKKADEALADEQGQIAIHLPHNSLLVMHAEMQEEWKHSIAPAAAIDPHPIAGNKRLNITYRCYREAFHPKHTPRCRCGVPTVLRCVQRKAESRGKYMWMCHAGYTPGSQGCSFFQWAEFDDDGEPPWAEKIKTG